MKANPYDSNTPEWQLCSAMLAAEAEARAAADDAHRATVRANVARERAEKYRAALITLDRDFEP